MFLSGAATVSAQDATSAPDGVASAAITMMAPGFTRAGLNAAVRQAVDAMPQPASRVVQDADWTRVVKLPLGDALLVTAADGLDSAPCRFITANATTLTMVRTDRHPPESAVKTFIEIAAVHPEILIPIDSDVQYQEHDVQALSGTIFVHGKRLGTLDELILRVPRQDVVEILEPAHRASSGLAIGVGTAIGLISGFFAGAALAFDDHAHTGAWPIPTFTIAGAIGGGLIGRELTIRQVQDVIYRR